MSLDANIDGSNLTVKYEGDVYYLRYGNCSHIPAGFKKKIAIWAALRTNWYGFTMYSKSLIGLAKAKK